MFEPLKPPRLKGTETVGEAVALLSEGNPGAIRVFMSVFDANSDVGLVMLQAADKTGFTGPLIWALYSDFAQTYLRAAALLIMCAELELPTPQELQRDVENSRRTRLGPSPLLEKALETVADYVPMFAGLDLKKPEAVT